jgi:hypothetical protein
MSKPEMTDVIEDAIACGLYSRSLVDDSTVLGDVSPASLAKFSRLQRQRERTGEAVAEGWKIQVLRDDGTPNGKPSYLPLLEAQRHCYYLEDDNYKFTYTEFFLSPPSPPSSRELLDVPEQVRKALEVAAKLLAGDATYNGSYAVFKFNSHAEAMAKVFEARHEIALAISLIPQEPSKEEGKV